MRLAEPLLAAAAAEQRNTVFSPYSASLALTLVLNGARSETKDELLGLLASRDISLEDLNAANEVVMNILAHDDPDVEVRIANAIWAQKGMTLRDDYVSGIRASKPPCGNCNPPSVQDLLRLPAKRACQACGPVFSCEERGMNLSYICCIHIVYVNGM